MFLPRIVEASRAHVLMLGEAGLLPPRRVRQLLEGLERLRGGAELPDYDGTFEDVYFAFERLLADAAGVPRSGLDVQLARSRNDLDAAIFRMILRDQLAEVASAAVAAAEAGLEAAERTTDAMIMAYTHRRPAQPTTIAHVLAGYVEALAGEIEEYDHAIDALQASPLGACAIAGTDLPIDPQRLADLLGFERRPVNSYEAVAGADHLMSPALVNARALATGARLVRVLQDWMAWQWIVTQAEFCQGSSIMPQKRNPVVLEHLVSMTGMTVADAVSVLGNVSSAWWEDSNNATTDVQVRLWESNDRSRRFFTLLGRLLTTLEVGRLPDAEEIVAAGTTTTAAADVLSRAGVPFRAAHGALSALVSTSDPRHWTIEGLRAAVAERAADVHVADGVLADVLDAAVRPQRVLDRPQDDGPGSAAVTGQLTALRARVDAVAGRMGARRDRIAEAQRRLDAAVEDVLR
jgi:argininosuccinate lyase